MPRNNTKEPSPCVLNCRTNFSKPTLTASAIKVLRNGDKVKELTGILSIQLPEGLDIDTSLDIELLDDEDDTLAVISGFDVDSNGFILADLGKDGGGEVIVLLADESYKLVIAKDALINEFNMKNDDDITLEFIAPEIEVAKPQIEKAKIESVNSTGTKFVIELTIDIPVNVAAGTIGKIYDENLKALDLIAEEINVGDEDAIVTVNTEAFNQGDFKDGGEYTITIQEDVFTSILGEKNDAIVVADGFKLQALDTLKPSLLTAQINSPYQAVFTFDKEIKLQEDYKIVFAGIDFEEDTKNSADVSEMTLTLTSEDGEIPTAIPAAGFGFDITEGLESSVGVHGTFNDDLKEEADNDEPIILDNAAAVLIRVQLASATEVKFVLSEIVSAEGDSIALLIGGKEYELTVTGSDSTLTLNVPEDEVKVGDSVYIPTGLKGKAKDEALGVINTIVEE